MKFEDYPKFFSAITKLFVEDSDFYKTFVNYNFDPNLWPECSSKEVAVKFHLLAQEKSVDYARMFLKSAVENFSDYQIAENQNDLIIQFEQFKKYGIWLQAGKDIVKNPFKADEIIALTQKQNTSLINAIMVQEKLDSHIQKHLENLKNKKETIKRISQWPQLSDVIGGFNGGRISLFVADTGLGKTTLTLNMAIDACKNTASLLINMEMTTEDMLDRIIQIGAGLTRNQWKRDFAQNEQEKINSMYTKLFNGKPFFMTDGRSLTIDQIKSLIFKYKNEFNVEFVVIDYDQKIRTSFKGEEWATVLKAVEELEEVAKATNTFILVLAQGDENNNPKASKRSKQPASSVIGLTRDDFTNEYYLKSMKNRHGPPFKIKLDCDMSIFRMKEGELIKENIVLPQKSR